MLRALLVNLSKVYVHSVTQLDKNKANNGGGIYLYRSELRCEHGGTLILKGNHANKSWGGIYSSTGNSSVKNQLKICFSNCDHDCSSIYFVKNYGTEGGDIFLSRNSTVYVYNYHISNMICPLWIT